jgi:hypothetical protein
MIRKHFNPLPIHVNRSHGTSRNQAPKEELSILTQEAKEGFRIVSTIDDLHEVDGTVGNGITLLSEHSPLDQVPFMPDIPYLVVHSDQDRSVDKMAHSDRMVTAMHGRNLDVEHWAPWRRLPARLHAFWSARSA